MNTVFVSLEGNIGSGKSTFLNYLKEFYCDRQEICFLDEPVEVWNSIRDENGVTILEKYYADQAKYAFDFQMMAYISRLSAIKGAMRAGCKIIISERSLQTDCNVFAQMLHKSGKITPIQFLIYSRWYHEFLTELPPCQYVYVRADPLESYQRIKTRGRIGEEEIHLAYLTDCHAHHENWLMQIPAHNLLILNAHEEFSLCKSDWLEKLQAFIPELK
jgi:deoxyadenosine/deoxycytidine kinase